MAERTVSWPAADDCALLGKEVDRVDGVPKATGHAKYTADINPKGTLYARLLTCPHGAAKVASLDMTPAERMKGVHATYVFRDVGAECRWDGQIVAAVAAERDEIARDAVNAIKVKFEPLDHFVNDEDLDAAREAGRAKEPSNKVDGADVEDALAAAKHVHTGRYGASVITHCCLEPHGSHCEWKTDDELLVHISTQAVSGAAGQFAGPLGIEQSGVRVICDYIGGGFGSKFQVDEWGIACAEMAKKAQRPVRLMLDRATELQNAGNRPSAFGEITVGADADGRIVAWDSHHWGTSGMKGATVDINQFPYVFSFPNQRRKATGVACNIGDQRAWRAPNHPQLCAMTCTAIDDLAAKMGMDSLEVFLKNIDQTGPKAPVYAEELKIAADLIGWKEHWHPHGKGEAKKGVRRGLGLALHRWGGAANAGSCVLKINPDGSVETSMGTQDIGTGTRTAIAIVVAETFGLPVEAIKVRIGSNEFPEAGGSGGSTTIGGVTGPNRRAALLALSKSYADEKEQSKLPDGIFDLVVAKYGVDPETLRARDGKIWSDDREVCTWKQAASLAGPNGIRVQGVGPLKDGLTDAGVGGVQMADVSVDTKTGQVHINRFVAVQDMGLVVDRKTARSQILGAMIMGIAYALTEEVITDPKTVRFINANLEDYKLPRIGDIGELVVEIYEPESERARGVIGLGEPPVISPGAAISNAVCNALGVRVPVLPLTPKRVLDALKGAQA